MSALPDTDGTVSHALQEGLALALKAEDGGDWKAVIDWQARHPHLAGELAGFLAAERGIKPLVAPLRAAAPTSVGGLQLRGVIGRGAMGVVHRAFDPTLNRAVAVKLLHPGDELSADDRARFRFEAEAVASLDHPNVVPVLASGEEGGVPFLVMPLMAGGSLAAWLKAKGDDRGLRANEAAAIVRDIARGIHHAHQRGLIHRDLKPANILRDDAGNVRVADFGLARPADLTATKIAGTAAYMAPEQTGTGKRLTTAVDVHALGVILFELLAGGPPFGGGDFGSVLRKVADEQAPPVRTYRPDVPRDLEAIVAKCLEKRPEDRYPSALALAEDLDNFLDGRPVTAGERGVFIDLSRAFSFRVEPQSLFAHRGTLIGSASTLVGLGWIQAAVLFDAPRWVSWAGLGYYLVAWAVILWVFLVIFRRRMKPVERVNGVFHVGMWLGAVALTPVMLWLHEGNVAPLFAPMLVVVGLGLFAGGVTLAGRHYLDGILVVLIAALMPLVPVKFWPGVYGVTLTVAQLWFGVYLKRFGREAESSNPPA